MYVPGNTGSTECDDVFIGGTSEEAGVVISEVAISERARVLELLRVRGGPALVQGCARAAARAPVNCPQLLRAILGKVRHTPCGPAMTRPANGVDQQGQVEPVGDVDVIEDEGSRPG